MRLWSTPYLNSLKSQAISRCCFNLQHRKFNCAVYPWSVGEPWGRGLWIPKLSAHNVIDITVRLENFNHNNHISFKLHLVAMQWVYTEVGVLFSKDVLGQRTKNVYFRRGIPLSPFCASRDSHTGLDEQEVTRSLFGKIWATLRSPYGYNIVVIQELDYSSLI